MQIAITVPDDVVDEIDALVPTEFRSRAEFVRVALDDLLKQLRSRRLDAQYLTALRAAAAPSDDGWPVLRDGDPEPAGWNDIPW